jgi:DNA-binding transcriptional regulator LsrR (DeoR family)
MTRVMVGRPPKLNPEQVVTLRARYKAGVTQAELSRQFSISEGVVRRYLQGNFKNPMVRALCAEPLVNAWRA